MFSSEQQAIRLGYWRRNRAKWRALLQRVVADMYQLCGVKVVHLTTGIDCRRQMRVNAACCRQCTHAKRLRIANHRLQNGQPLESEPPIFVEG